MSAANDFLGIWRGLWLFTWKARLGWRRIPMKILVLLLLPALVYISLPSRHETAQLHASLGRPDLDLREFNRMLGGKSGPKLNPELHNKIIVIMFQEYGAEEVNWLKEEEAAARVADHPDDGEIDPTKWAKHYQACAARISEKIKPLLDENQLNRWEDFASKRADHPPTAVHNSSWNRESAFYHLLIDFYFFVILPLGCVRGAGALIRDEVLADTLGFLVTRPLRRHELVILKCFSHVTWQEIIFCVQALLIFAAGYCRGVIGLGGLLPLFLAVQFLAVPAWNALGLLLGLATRWYFAMALLYGVVVELGIGLIPTNINTLSLMRHLRSLLSHNAALQAVYDWSARGTLFSVGALALATFIFVTGAALLFTFREYHHAAEMQK